VEGSTNESVVVTLNLEQRRLTDLVVDSMNPVSPRATGVAFDNRAALPNEGISAIRAPTLVLHAKDDTLQLHHNAEFAAAHIPGAQLVSFERGGHLLMIVERERVRTLTPQHIAKHSSDAKP
jgi:pimeloyl-ACP methyl ester carboxylesterase